MQSPHPLPLHPRKTLVAVIRLEILRRDRLIRHDLPSTISSGSALNLRGAGIISGSRSSVSPAAGNPNGEPVDGLDVCSRNSASISIGYRGTTPSGSCRG